LAPWGYDIEAPAEDGGLLCDGLVLHRVVAPRASHRQKRAELPATAQQARRDYEDACRRLADGPAPLVTPSGLEQQPGDAPDSAAVPRERARELGRTVGQVIHQLLDGWNGESREATLQRVDRLCERTTSGIGIDRAALRREARELAESFLASALAPKLAAVERVGCELPVLARWESGRVLSGNLDLLYRDADGSWVVADFKTDREPSPERLCRVYGGQLRAYAEATRKALGLLLPPRAEIWSLRDGAIIVVDGMERR
jgi:ATP-dependent exoDNAse (exonuclease V) beta subunit